MKKSLIALSVLAAASAVAFADSSVTLYGKIDAGVGVVKAKGDPAKVSVDSGNYMGSRWGIRGVEELGGGNVAGFQLEQGFSADTGNLGSSSRQFHRISRLYLAGDWGEIGIGRFGAIASGTGPYDLLGETMYLGNAGFAFGGTEAWDMIAGNQSRVDNAIVYVSPNFAGFKFEVMYSNKTDGSSVDDSANKWSKDNHYYGIGGIYKANGLVSVLTFDVRDQKGLGGWGAMVDAYNKAAEAGTSYSYSNLVEKAIYNLNFNVEYDFGVIIPRFAYTWTSQSDVASQHTFGLSAMAPVAGGKVGLGVRYAFGSLDGLMKDGAKSGGFDDKYRLLTVNLMGNYPISKRTLFYGYAGWTHGSKGWSKDGKTANFFNNNTIIANGYAIMAGMIHDF